MSKFGIGQGIPRWEDPRLLRGGGRYTDDLNRAGQLYGAVVRSPYANAVIRAIDTDAASSVAGVRAIYTGVDLEAAGYGMIPCSVARNRADGTPMYQPPNFALRRNEVKFVGDYVAFVVAETSSAARDAAELVEVDYAPQAAVTDAQVAIGGAGASVWSACPDNVCFVFEQGDRASVERAFEAAAHRVSVDLAISRVAVAPMEPRACIGEYDAFEKRFTLYSGTQAIHGLRQALAGPVLGVAPSDLRVVSEDMGGAFGMRCGPYPEHILCLHAARALGRPVKWTADRSESFMSDDQARDNSTHAELALDTEGRFIGLRVKTTANLGAYLTMLGPHSPTMNLGSLSGPYRTPSIHCEVTGVFTHTPPVGPYRGAGRPEAAYVIERLIDTAARQIGLDPAELRRRNYIAIEQLPFDTPLGFRYDSGQFEANMDEALAMIDYHDFEVRRRAALNDGLWLGIGMSNVIEQSAGGPPEWAQVRFDASGIATLTVGTHSHGQGHETVFRQILAAELGIDYESIRFEQGDSAAIVSGTGTFGSRSSGVGGASVQRAALKVIDKCRQVAAHILETSAEDIDFEAGGFAVVGTDRRVSLTECVRVVSNFMTAPPGIEPGVSELAAWTPGAPTFPNGCHVCEVSIDPETGVVKLVRYVAVDDVGTVLNPLLMEGQLHGGIVQGFGQILGESMVWDQQTGQMLTGSFMDYTMPRADALPMFELGVNEAAPTPTNPLGVKGAGEAGCVGAMPAIMNAIHDALHTHGIESIDMPVTPMRVWAALAPDRA